MSCDVCTSPTQTVTTLILKADIPQLLLDWYLLLGVELLKLNATMFLTMIQV